MVVPLKDKRGISIVNGFQKRISKGRKPNKIWVDLGGEFYNDLFKRFLKINNIDTYSTYNEGKSVLLRDLLGPWITKSLGTWQLFQKDVYFDDLDGVVNKYNNTVHRTIKVKRINVTSDSYTEYNEDFNEKDPKFKVGYPVRISKYKNIFVKGHSQNCSEEVFVVSKIKYKVPWTYVVSDLNGEPVTECFREKELQKTSQEKLRTEKIIKKKVDKL